MKVEKYYAGVDGALFDDVWIYGLNVANPQIQINGAGLDASKIDFDETVEIFIFFFSLNFVKCYISYRKTPFSLPGIFSNSFPWDNTKF